MIDEITKILRNHSKFLVVTHVNPDGDAVGSLLGLHLALREMGKSVRSLTAEEIPDLYHFMPGIGDVIVGGPVLDDPPEWIISVDAADQYRISGDISGVRPPAGLINIDHHPTNPHFGDVNFVDPTATSTAELVLRVIEETGHPLSADVGKCLYTGLITDTGCFRFAGVTAETMRTAAALLASGFESADVTMPLFEELPLYRLRLEQVMLERLEAKFDGRLVISILFKSDLERLGAQFSDTENLVNRLREVRGAEVGILVIETASGGSKASLRSKHWMDVATIAKDLGGGGHRNASGLKSDMPPAELKSVLEEAVAQQLSEPSAAVSSRSG